MSYLLRLLSQKCYFQRLEEKSITLSLQFLKIVNKQDSSIQYTTGFENNQNQLNFLNITITNNGTVSYDSKIFRKPAITNVQIKSNSNMAPNVSVSVFKGFMYSQRMLIKEKLWNRQQKII